MKVSIYDNAAQANFINTFVPIKFDELYDMAKTATKEKEEASGLLDQMSSYYSSLKTPSEVDSQIIKTKAIDVVNKIVEEAASNSENLKDPAFRAKMKSVSRRLAGDADLKSAISNIPLMNNFLSNMDERWRGAEAEYVRTHNSAVNGAFTRKNIKFMSPGEMYDPAVDQLKEEITYSKDGMTMTKGISKDRVRRHIDLYKQTASATSPAEMYKRVYFNPNDPANSQYVKKDKDGNIISADADSWLADRGFAEQSDRINESVAPSEKNLLLFKQRLEDASRARIEAAKKAEIEAEKVDQVELLFDTGINIMAQNHKAEMSSVVNLMEASDNAFKQGKTILKQDSRKLQNLKKYDPDLYNSLATVYKYRSYATKANEELAKISSKYSDPTKITPEDKFQIEKLKTNIIKFNNTISNSATLAEQYYSQAAADVVSRKRPEVLGLSKADIEKHNSFKIPIETAQIMDVVDFGKPSYTAIIDGTSTTVKQMPIGFDAVPSTFNGFEERNDVSSAIFSHLNKTGKLPSGVYIKSSDNMTVAPDAMGGKRSAFAYVRKAEYDAAVLENMDDMKSKKVYLSKSKKTAKDYNNGAPTDLVDFNVVSMGAGNAVAEYYEIPVHIPTKSLDPNDEATGKSSLEKKLETVTGKQYR